MVSQHNYDIVIVGAGLVGATLAAVLAANPNTCALKIAVVDAAKPPAQLSDIASNISSNPSDKPRFDPRVVALTRQSQELLESVGVWQAFINQQQSHQACPYQRMTVWDKDGTGEITFDCHEIHEDNLGFIVENSLVLRHLIDSISQHDTIHLIWQDAVQSLSRNGANQLILASGTTVKADLVLAADGANSRIREMAGIETRAWPYGHKAIVTTVKTEQEHQSTAWQSFSHQGPLAFLPLLDPNGDQHYSSIVWSVFDEEADKLMALNEQQFALRLSEQIEHRLGAVEAVDKRFCFPLHQRHAKQYFQPGLALLGDAAHSIHPLAGQGVNLGLLDVRAVATEIERAIQRGIPLPDMSILKRYQRARMGSNLAMMAAMEGFKQLFGNQKPFWHVLRNLGIHSANSSPLLKTAMAKRAMGL